MSVRLQVAPREADGEVASGKLQASGAILTTSLRACRSAGKRKVNRMTTWDVDVPPSHRRRSGNEGYPTGSM